MADQELKSWAGTVSIDGLTNSPQRRDILDEEFLNGWLRNTTVSAQQLNSILYLLSTNALPHPNCASLFPDSTTVPSVALELNGQSITESEYPNAYALYGSTLPNISGDAPTGFTYIIRAS